MRLLVAMLSMCLMPACVLAASDTNVSTLARLAPEADARVLSLALEARQCASHQLGQAPSARLAVIDYSRASTQPRLWVFDLERRVLLFRELVAHGQGTGENMAREFSNRDGSHQSSLGLFRTADTYQGNNGYSLRMQGLEPGTNDAAMARAIVMHGAPYVSASNAREHGRLGRSWGCPALRPEVAHAVIDSLKNGQMIFAYYPNTNWLAHSPFLGCHDKMLASNRSPLPGPTSIAATTSSLSTLASMPH